MSSKSNVRANPGVARKIKINNVDTIVANFFTFLTPYKKDQTKSYFAHCENSHGILYITNFIFCQEQILKIVLYLLIFIKYSNNF